MLRAKKRKSNRFCNYGTDHWIKGGDLVDGSNWMSDESLEEYRIKQGVPKWGCELNLTLFPKKPYLSERALISTRVVMLDKKLFLESRV